MTEKEAAMKRKLLRRYEQGIKDLSKFRSEVFQDPDPQIAELRELMLKEFEFLTNLLKENAESIT